MKSKLLHVILALSFLTVLPVTSNACNATPEAIISPPIPKWVHVNHSLLLDGSDSTDDDGDIIECKWDFDDSDGLDWDNPDAIGSEVYASYTAVDQYTVTLRVKDDGGLTHTNTCIVYVVYINLEMGPGEVRYIAVNNDDDNTDGDMDVYDIGVQTAEDDLVEILLHVVTPKTTDKVTLSLCARWGDQSSIKLWSHRDKQNLLIPDEYNNYHRRWTTGSCPDRLYAEGTKSSVVDSPYLIFTYTGMVGEVEYPVWRTPTAQLDDFTVVEVDVDMDGVKDDDYYWQYVTEEITPGGFIALNADDDDDNEKADKDESGPITDEDNLVKITLRKVKPTALTGNVTLDTTEVEDRSKIKIWESQTKGGSPITLPATYATPTGLPKELWVEGFENSSSVGDITLALEYSIGGKTFDDKIKLTVIKVDVEVAGGDDDTYEIPSVKVPSKVPDDHFVTVKGEGDIKLWLWATTIPDDLLVDETITWTGMTQHPLEKLAASKPRTTSGKFPATINVCGRDAKDLTNWVVWSTGNTLTFSKSPPTSCLVRTGDGTIGPGMYVQITVTSGFAFTISPTTIITNSDRPDISGSPSPVPGASQTHVITGSSLAGGANNVWDESRRIRVKVLNPHLYTQNQLEDLSGHLYNAQPVAMDIPESYPSNDVIGNDDVSTGEPEDNDPYNSPNIGQLTGSDSPMLVFRHSTGSDSDTFEVRSHFGEFARLKLGNTWYRVSNFTDWKTHFKYKRVGGQWIDDGSFGAANNTGF